MIATVQQADDFIRKHLVRGSQIEQWTPDYFSFIFNGDCVTVKRDKLSDEVWREIKALWDDRQHRQDRQKNDTQHIGGQDELTVTTWNDTRNVVKKVSWIWSGWLPRGYVTMVASESGTGKSGLILWIAGLFTNCENAFEREFPNNGGSVERRGKILWIETEFAQSMNLERLEKFGLDANDFLNPLESALDTVSLQNDEHKARIRQIAHREDVVLIVLDSLSGSHTKKENDTEVKEILLFLAELARDTDKPLIVTHHFNKLSTDGKEPDLNRVRGSSAIVQFPRVIWALDVPDALNPKRKRLSNIKNNLCFRQPAIGFEVVDDGREVLFTEAPESKRPQSAVEKAVVWLAAYLRTARRAAQKEIEEQAEKCGFKYRTLERAKKILRVESSCDYNRFTKVKTWYWELPKENNEHRQENDTQNIGGVGGVGGHSYEDYDIPF